MDAAADSVVLDTPAAVLKRVVDSWQAMSVADRFAQVAALNDSCERMAEAGVRLRHPCADSDEVRLRLFALRLGRDLMVTVYGWDPFVKGW